MVGRRLDLATVYTNVTGYPGSRLGGVKDVWELVGIVRLDLCGSTTSDVKGETDGESTYIQYKTSRPFLSYLGGVGHVTISRHRCFVARVLFLTHSASQCSRAEQTDMTCAHRLWSEDALHNSHSSLSLTHPGPLVGMLPGSQRWLAEPCFESFACIVRRDRHVGPHEPSDASPTWSWPRSLAISAGIPGTWADPE